jgi:hypothetical protein
MNREQELELRLAESRHTETELRRVIDVLLHEGDAVFASRSWRLGRGLTGLVERLRRLLGGAPAPAQDAAHWRRIVAAHDDGLARRRALLERLCAKQPVEDLDSVLAELWNGVAAEQRSAP